MATHWRDAGLFIVWQGPKPLKIKLIRLVSLGMKNQEIARRLGIKEQVVKRYIQETFETLGFGNRVELALWYIKYYEQPSTSLVDRERAKAG